MDPRVTATAAEIGRQYELSRGLDAALRRVGPALTAARGRGDAGAAKAQELQRISAALAQLFGQVEGADVAPTSQLTAAVRDAIAAADRALQGEK
jgi:hypothetical protein